MAETNIETKGESSFISSLIKVESVYVVLIIGILVSFALFWQVKTHFFTREEGTATSQQITDLSTSIRDLTLEVRDSRKEQRTEIMALRTELKTDMIENNRLTLSRISEVTDRLINKIDKESSELKNTLRRK